MKNTSRCLAALASTALTAGLVVGGASASQAQTPQQTRAQAAAQVDAAAADTCAGSRVALMQHKSYQGVHVANTGVYRSGDDWCAVTVKVGSLYGTASRMSLTLTSRNGRSDDDTGTFRYQAGPVRVANAGCVYTDLAMWNAQGREILQDYSYGGFGNCP
jgi:hypothetical protein